MFDNLFSLAGKVAVVTGGSRGIGRMIASGFLAYGVERVYIPARKAAACAGVIGWLGVSGVKRIAWLSPGVKP